MKKFITAFLCLSAAFISSCSKENERIGLEEYKKKDYVKAKVMAEKACGDKNAEACYILANIYFLGLSSGIDHVKAVRLYINSCDEGNGRACYILGKLYNQGKYVHKDDFQSEAYYRKSNKMLYNECEKKNPESCLYAGALYLYSLGVPHNAEKAIHFFGKACDLKYGAGCWTLGWLYEKERFNIPKNDMISSEYYEKACRFGYSEGCK